MSRVRTSPERNTFQLRNKLDADDKSIADEFAKLLEQIRQKDFDNINDPEWCKNNLEYDLRSTDWIVNKVQTSDIYAQNLYAAMCNREFTKNEVWPLLTEKRWSCSWRYAGGIIAHMREKGDYIDWYCSGIRNDWSDEEFCNASKEDQEEYLRMKNQYVAESEVTYEIREDLLKLGWVVIDD